MKKQDKPLVWLHGEIKTPPFSASARIEADAIIILEVFNKKTQQTPKRIINVCQKRIKDYDNV